MFNVSGDRLQIAGMEVGRTAQLQLEPPNKAFVPRVELSPIVRSASLARSASAKIKIREERLSEADGSESGFLAIACKSGGRPPCVVKEPAPSGRKSGSRQSYRAKYVRDPFSKIWLPRARGFGRTRHRFRHGLFVRATCLARVRKPVDEPTHP